MRPLCLLFLLVLCIALPTSNEARRRGKNCGIACYKFEKCLKQISGKGTRPGQLGNTGQLVLKSCDVGECDCEAEAAKKKAKRDQRNSTTTPVPSKPKKTAPSKNLRGRFGRRPLPQSPKKTEEVSTPTTEETTTPKSSDDGSRRIRRFNPRRPYRS
eukprot:TRINITY_DN17186_c0_g1_i1.p1 TRINITY_DN17186_c0_g1~~TRINITY_DN17186_c0_g1_i1.p1  ORF type:complete len:157 (-),score=25.31 TRINITY_DN17186_c0_g1_i1:96-566(-)